MTVTYLSANRITGLSSDTKPTNVVTNSIFLETNTPARKLFNGSSWIDLGGGGTMGVDSNSNAYGGAYTYYRSGSIQCKNNVNSGYTQCSQSVTIPSGDNIVIATASVGFSKNTNSNYPIIATVLKDGSSIGSRTLYTGSYRNAGAVTKTVTQTNVSAGTYTYATQYSTGGSGGFDSGLGQIDVVVITLS
jgi:hypothetical protein